MSDKLAIDGGTPVLTRKDFKNWPIIGPDERRLGGRNTISVDVNDLIFRKISLIPTFAEPAINFPVSSRLLRDGLVDAKSLVTHTFGFSEALKVLGGIVDGTLPAIKAVMLPNG